MTGADDEDVSYAMACITLFGTITTFSVSFRWPAGRTLHTAICGLWIGLSAHEVAQVVGSAFQGGAEAGEIAVVTKLARVMILAPLIIGLSCFLALPSRQAEDKRGRTQFVPFFVIGFLILAALNSFGLAPEVVRAPIVAGTPVLLTVAMAALGLGTNTSKLKKHGLSPLLLGAMASVFIAGVGFLMVTFVLR